VIDLDAIAIDAVGSKQPADLYQRLSWLGMLPFALTFGALLGLSCTGYGYWWFAWCGLAPLLVLLIRCRTSLQAILAGYCFGLGFHLLTLSWYFGLLPLKWAGVSDWLAGQMVALAWLSQAGYQALLIALFAWLVYCLPLRAGYLPYFRRPFFPYLLSVPIIWLVTAWYIGTSHIFGGIPIDQLAYSQSNNISLIQIAKLGGSGLVDFLIVMVNAAVAEILVEFSKIGPQVVERVDLLSPRVGSFVDLAIALILVASSVAWGRGQVIQYVNKASRPGNLSAPVALIQSNVMPEEERRRLTGLPNVARQEQELVKNLGVSMIVLPEGSVDASKGSMLFANLKNICNNENKEVIVGSVERLNGKLVNAARFIFPGEVHPEVNSRGLYVKRRLVPFLDMFPWTALRLDMSGLVPDTIDKLPGLAEQFVTLDSPQLLKSRWGNIGPAISFEIIFPELIAQQVRKGASLIVNLTNFSWCNNPALNKQLLAAAVLRAVENQRSVILCSNTGVSAVIDADGLVTSKSAFASRGTLMDTVQFLCEKTMFTRMWWL
jgi:apolipoprotein N-acyltransferase